VPNQFEVWKTPVPTVETDIGGLKSPLMHRSQQICKTVILAQLVVRLVINAMVARNMLIAVCPQQRQQINAPHCLPDQAHLLGK
jgi:hypothetical protein